MKKALSLLLVLVMVLGLAACGNNNTASTESKETKSTEKQSEKATDATQESKEENPFVQAENWDDPDVYTTQKGGSITTAKTSGGTGSTVSTDVYAGIAGKDYTDPKYYTFNDYMGAMGSGLDWNPHTWETNEDSLILDYITMGLYGFALNSDKSGYSVVPEMAAEFPVDVTSEYVGKFGVAEGETAKAWRIALNKNAVWDDANKTPINADTYIYSMQQQLNPKMLNRRADSYYAGDQVIVGAKGYLYSAGGDTYDAIEDLAAAVASGAELYVDMWGFWGLEGMKDEQGNDCPQYVAITDEVKYHDLADAAKGTDEEWVSAKYIYDTYLAEGKQYNSYAADYIFTKAANTTWTAVEDLAAAIAAGKEIYVDMWGFWGLEGMKDEKGNDCPQYVVITDEVKYHDLADAAKGTPEEWVSAKYIYETYLAEGKQYAAYATTYLGTMEELPPTTWEDVGLVKVDDYTIDIIYTKPIEEASFYLPYSLSSNWIVYEPLYETCKTFWDADGKEISFNDAIANPDSVASITTNYFTALDNTISYGPYKLTGYELDKQITLERNDNWYGYADGKHKGQYQMDKYYVEVIKEHKTALLAFLAGDLDGVSLESDDMNTYATSDRIVYTPQDYTTKVSFNTNYESLLAHGTNSQILSVMEFRKAFCYAVDNTQFASAYTSAGEAGYGLLNYMYCYNPFTGGLYRENDAAKDALVRLFGLEYGAGKDFDDLDEAYDAITGYDMDYAKELMQIAYDKAVAASVYDGTSPISIDFRVYAEDEIYVKMFTYFKTQLEEACKGTDFEGKVTMTMTVDADYYETMYSGNADMIFTTWGGAAMQPFTILNQCYTDASDGSGNQMEYGFRTEDIPVAFTIDGKEYTHSLHDWADWIGSVSNDIAAELGSISDYSYETRCAMLAEMEYQFLNQFTTFSVYYRNVASLNSRKVESASDAYLQLVGFGGIAFTTFNYDDTEWAAIKANQTY